MNRQRWVLFAVALALIGGTAGLLGLVFLHPKTGLPGVRTSPLPGSIRLQVDLPERVLDYGSTNVLVDGITTNVLPPDTSFGQRLYTRADGFELLVNVVLMGTDRSSLHKPQFCLTGQGWNIDDLASASDTVRMEKPISYNPTSYNLPVVKLVATKDLGKAGQPRVARGVYVYWFVADGAISASTSGIERMWWMARELFRTGKLQRWAYISCFSVCAPGQEGPTYERMKQFIAAATPEFQLPPREPPRAAASAAP